MVTVSAPGPPRCSSVAGTRPWPISIWSGANSGWYPVLWFLGKLIVFIFFFIWLRGSLPPDPL